MRATTVAAAAGVLTQTASAALQAKNVIYVIPDGWGPASQTVSRDLHWLIETGYNGTNPQIGELAADEMVRKQCMPPYYLQAHQGHVGRWSCPHSLGQPPHHRLCCGWHSYGHRPQDEQWLDRYHTQWSSCW
jgi:hypothetical protein